MKQIAARENRMFLFQYPTVMALVVIVLVGSVPLMTNYCIDGVDVSFYLWKFKTVCPEDIFLLLPSLFVRMGMRTEAVYKLLLFALNVITAVISYFCFRGIFQDRMIAATGSMLYTWAPYRINDLYCRADLGEAIALCFLPVVFWGLYRVYEDDTDSPAYKRLWIVLALGYTLIVQAYLLSFFVIGGFTLLFCMVMRKRTFRKPVLLILLKTAVVFLICNSWLFLRLLKLMRENSLLLAAFRGEQIQCGGVYPFMFLQLFFLNGSSFRTEEIGTRNIQPLGAGFAVTAGVLVYLWLVFVGRYREKEDEGGICGFGKGVGITGAILAVMATNALPWDYIQKRNSVFFRLVESLQSPARLMQVVTVCFTLVTCAALWQIKKWEKSSVSLTVIIVTAALALLTTQYLTGDILRTGTPRSLYGEEYGEPEGEERLLPENLDISPWDYGKYVSLPAK